MKPIIKIVIFICVLNTVHCYEVQNSGYVKEVKQFFTTAKDRVQELFNFLDNDIDETVKSARDIDDDNDVMLYPSLYNPDEDLTTPQIIARHGYRAESHVVQTEDGYLLTLHRIPHGKLANLGKKRHPIFLHHGLLASSADWIFSGPKKALPYILADLGYDVWMGNVRGNTYSRAHVNMSSQDSAFWDFTWHEVGFYDLPASIDYINDITKSDKNLIYVGHSMGTTVLFVLLSSRLEYNQKMKAAFAFAPVAYMDDIESPIKYLSPYVNDIKYIADLFGHGEILPQSNGLQWLASLTCLVNKWQKKICENSMFLLCGFDRKEFNVSLLPVILKHNPAGASTKTILHYAQEINARGRFQRFDYGVEENLERYHSKTPPAYNISKISLPLGLFTAKNDWLSGADDASRIYEQLQNPIELYKVPMEEFNHLDYMWGIDADTLVYKKLLQLLKTLYN